MVQTRKIAVIGLGYVGLPLAVAFGRHAHTIGFDVQQKRIDELKNGIDSKFHKINTKNPNFPLKIVSINTK